jgi:polysaccharide export outer membrane protein
MEFSLRTSSRRARAFLPLLVVAAGIAACGRPNFDPAKANMVAVAAELPEPTIADIYGQSRDTRIGPGDKLEIAVLGVDDLKRTIIVDGGGAIAYPLVGRIEALGMTPADLASTLQTRLGERYLQDPQVTVIVSDSVSQRFTIYGGVVRPGLYPLVGDATLTDAIALANGTNQDARLSEVVVFRSVEGKRMAARFDLREISGGRANDPAVYPGDRIVVGSDNSRSLLRDIAPLTPILGIFYQIL